jgi:hypothetical protein
MDICKVVAMKDDDEDNYDSQFILKISTLKIFTF